MIGRPGRPGVWMEPLGDVARSTEPSTTRGVARSGPQPLRRGQGSPAGRPTYYPALPHTRFCLLCTEGGVPRHSTWPSSTAPSTGAGGGGGGCQGTILTGIISDGENFPTSRNPGACCYFLVGFGWKQTHLCSFPPPGTPLHMSEFTVLTRICIHSEIAGHALENCAGGNLATSPPPPPAKFSPHEPPPPLVHCVFCGRNF